MIDHCGEPEMHCDAFWLPKSVIADANAIQMPALQVHVCAENAGVGVSEWAAETNGIWQGKGCETTQQKDTKVRECVWELAQSMCIINTQGTGPEQWDLLIDCCVTRISNLAFNRPLWTWYMADKRILDGQKLEAALDEFAEAGLCSSKTRIDESRTKEKKFVNGGMYFIAPMLPWLLLMLSRFKRCRGRNLRSPVFAHQGTLRRLNWFPRRAI